MGVGVGVGVGPPPDLRVWYGAPARTPNATGGVKRWPRRSGSLPTVLERRRRSPRPSRKSLARQKDC